MGYEYPTVLKYCEFPEKLIELYKTLITQEEARKIIFDYLSEDEIYDIRFTSKKGRGYCQYIDENRVMIRLPVNPNQGVTLHELVHALCWIDKGVRGHKREFISTFNNVIRSEIIYKNHEE